MIWRLKWLCRPLQMCICLTADKYTFIVPCEMFEEARYDMNKVRVHSDVGIGTIPAILQNLTYHRRPAT